MQLLSQNSCSSKRQRDKTESRNLKTRAEEGAGSAKKPRSSAGEGGKPNSFEAGVWLEDTENTWELLDSPPEEDINGAVPVTAANEGSDLKESPTKTNEAGLAPSVAPNVVTSKPPRGIRFRTNPEDTSDVVSGRDVDQLTRWNLNSSLIPPHKKCLCSFSILFTTPKGIRNKDR